jgi:hypothetical protein
MQSLPISAQDELWLLMSLLRTNPVMYAEIVSENSAGCLSKSSDNLPKLLYSLQIVESLINDYQQRARTTITYYYTESQETTS